VKGGEEADRVQVRVVRLTRRREKKREEKKERLSFPRANRRCPAWTIISAASALKQKRRGGEKRGTAFFVGEPAVRSRAGGLATQRRKEGERKRVFFYLVGSAMQTILRASPVGGKAISGTLRVG